MVKIYKVTFLEYSDTTYSTVTDGKNYYDAKDLLITEDQIQEYKKYGNGFDKLEYVGMLNLNKK